MLDWIAFIIFAIFALAGFFLSFLGISGPFFVLFGAILFDIITWSSLIPFWVIGIVALLAVIGELVEALIFFRAGLSREGWEGLFSGAVLGSSITGIGKFVGVILGSLAGVFIGEFKSGNARVAWRKTKSLIKRKLASSVIKVLIVLLQIWIVTANLS